MRWPKSKPNPVRVALVKRDGLKCKKCGCEEVEKLTLDHIIPIALGGSVRLKNLQLLCEDCHKEKDRNVGLKGYGGRRKHARRQTAWQEAATQKKQKNLLTND